MFETYDTKRFGEYIKNIRKKLKLTQEKVALSTKLSTETLRKIENGFVVPRYDTLEYLSRAYKIDVLEAFKNFRTSELLFNYYQHIDNIILDYDVNQILSLENELKKLQVDLEHESFLETEDHEQIKLMILGITSFYENHYDLALNSFILSMKKSHVNYKISSFDLYNYSIFESRILLMISMCKASQDELNLANQMLKHILIIFNNDDLSKEYIKLKIKIFFNLSYNSHTLNLLEETINYASDGIDFCLKNHSLYLLHGLFYRRGIAKFMLKDKSYSEDLSLSKTLLQVGDKKELLVIYEQVTKKNYSINM